MRISVNSKEPTDPLIIDQTERFNINYRGADRSEQRREKWRSLKSSVTWPWNECKREREREKHKVTLRQQCANRKWGLAQAQVHWIHGSQDICSLWRLMFWDVMLPILCANPNQYHTRVNIHLCSDFKKTWKEPKWQRTIKRRQIHQRWSNSHLHSAVGYYSKLAQQLDRWDLKSELLLILAWVCFTHGSSMLVGAVTCWLRCLNHWQPTNLLWSGH